MLESIYEKGDNLESLAIKAKNWFTINNVPVPRGFRMWQAAYVTRGEIPPGTGISSLYKYGFNVPEFICTVLNDPSKKPYNYNPLTKESLFIMGYDFISSTFKNKHKYVTVKCLKCGIEEELTYGKLQEAKVRNDKYCRYCRNVGGKEKLLDRYNIYEGFTIISKQGTRLSYRCDTCNNTLERTMAHASSSEYIVCEYCFPHINFGARHYTDLGYFDSKIEYEAYKVLLKYLDQTLIVRQKKYDDLFSTGTQHTADFYIPSLNLVLEVTTKTNNIGGKYKETAEWKKGLSETVKFAYSLSEVEDIVRSAMKIAELTATHWRSIRGSNPVERQRVTEGL